MRSPIEFASSCLRRLRALSLRDKANEYRLLPLIAILIGLRGFRACGNICWNTFSRIAQKQKNLRKNKSSERVFYILVFLCCSLQNDKSKDFFENVKRLDNGIIFLVLFSLFLCKREKPT